MQWEADEDAVLQKTRREGILFANSQKAFWRNVRGIQALQMQFAWMTLLPGGMPVEIPKAVYEHKNRLFSSIWAEKPVLRYKR